MDLTKTHDREIDPSSRLRGCHMTIHISQTYDFNSIHESQKEARHQDRLADGPSVAK